MTSIHSIQMSENGDDRSTDPMPSFAAYADEVRLFTIDAELIVSVESDGGYWTINGSDHFDWISYSDEPWSDAKSAVEYALHIMCIPLQEFMDMI